MQWIFRVGYPLLSTITLLTLAIFNWPDLVENNDDYLVLLAIGEFACALVFFSLLLVPKYRRECFNPKNATVSTVSILVLLIYCAIVVSKLHALINSTDL
jgi:hypothetical protein